MHLAQKSGQLKLLVGDRRARDGAAQVLKLPALVDATAHPRVQAEAVGGGREGLGHRCGAARCLSPAEHFAPRLRRAALVCAPVPSRRARANDDSTAPRTVRWLRKGRRRRSEINVAYELMEAEGIS